MLGNQAAQMKQIDASKAAKVNMRVIEKLNSFMY